MSASLTDFINPGLPVELGTIEKALGQLWEETDDSKTRASLINLVIYSEDPSSARENTEIIARLAGEHACRAMLVMADPSAAESSARAWISAHCQVVGNGTRQICSEQITFQLDGDAASSLPNIVFSHLDSDLPLVFWWQGEFREPIEQKFWSWVDRLIYDSRSWPDPAAQMALVNRIGQFGEEDDIRRTILCDLNWARLLGARFAFAKFFDHPFALRQLREVRRLRLEHGPGYRITALLLLGWLAAQLGWKLHMLLQTPSFQTADGREISFEMVEAGETGLGRLLLESDAATIDFVRPSGSDYYHATMKGNDCPATVQTLPAGRDGVVDILLNELNRGGRHPLYKKALDAIEPLL